MKKSQNVSYECCLDFIGQSNIYEISQSASLGHCLRPSKWHVRRSAGRNSRPIAKLRYPSEPPFDAESNLGNGRVDVKSGTAKVLKNWQRLIFDLAKTVWPMSHPSPTRSPPSVSSFTRCKLNLDRKFYVLCMSFKWFFLIVKHLFKLHVIFLAWFDKVIVKENLY